MGVDVDACFEYGYKVNFNDIPDGERRIERGFDDCSDNDDGYSVTICGDEFWCEQLVSGDNAYGGYDEQDWYIGVGLPSDSTIEELFDACRESRDTVEVMYEMVMRKPPTEEPRVHVYARWW